MSMSKRMWDTLALALIFSDRRDDEKHNRENVTNELQMSRHEMYRKQEAQRNRYCTTSTGEDANPRVGY
jgi:hypothetical protein